MHANRRISRSRWRVVRGGAKAQDLSPGQPPPSVSPFVTTSNFTYWLLCVFSFLAFVRAFLQHCEWRSAAAHSLWRGCVRGWSSCFSLCRCRAPLLLRRRPPSLLCSLGHVAVSPGSRDVGGRLPDENGTLGASSHDELLVWRDRDLHNKLVCNQAPISFLPSSRLRSGRHPCSKRCPRRSPTASRACRCLRR